MAKQTARYDFNITKGFTFSRSFKYRKQDGTAINLTGRVITFNLKQDSLLTFNSASSPTASGSKVFVTNAANGEFSLLLTDEETANLLEKEGRWWFSISGTSEVEDVGGRLDAILKGKIIVESIEKI